MCIAEYPKEDINLFKMLFAYEIPLRKNMIYTIRGFDYNTKNGIPGIYLEEIVSPEFQGIELSFESARFSPDIQPSNE